MSKACFKYVRVSPQKARAVVNMVRGKDAQGAMDTLKFCRRSVAQSILKLVKSAVANANQKGGVDVDNLYIKKITVGRGPCLKRWRARARGMAGRINKMTSHISIELVER